MKRLGNIVKITNGFAFKSSEYSESGGRVIRITNVQKGIIEDNNPKFYPENLLSKLNPYKISEGDILMSLTGNVGRVGRFPKDLLPAYINQRVCRVKSISTELVDDYLFHILNSDDFESRAINSSTGIAQMNLSTKWIEEFEIPLPPIETQKRIAQILDDAQALKQKTEQLLKEYDALAQSIFLDMFGDFVNNQKKWDKVQFDSVFNSIRYGTSSPPIYSKEGIPFIRATNVKNGDVALKGMVYISNEEAAKIKKCKLNEGDLIVVRSGANTGDCCRIPNKYQDAYGGFDLIIVIDEPYSTFYNFLLNTKAGKAILEPLTRRAGQPHLNSKQISELEVFEVPLHLQNQFAEKVALIEQQKELAKQELKESEDLFNCLLQKAFKGELV